MKIEHHIRARFESRLERHAALVIYDPERRYLEIARALAGPTVTVVDALGTSLEAREQALEHWLCLAEVPGARLVVYVPAAKPLRIEEVLQDPFLAMRVGGAEFPAGPGDEYIALCKQAFPSQLDKIETLFGSGTPDFATINALEQGVNWPALRTALSADSPVEIVIGLIAPSAEQESALDDNAGARQEVRDFLIATLGMAPVEEVPSVDALVGPLWRYVLFSEFALDLSSELPASLQHVPRASERQRTLVYRICEALRSSSRTRELYLERAAGIQDELAIPQRMHKVEELGSIETFPFENVSAFRRFCAAFQRGDLGTASEIDTLNQASIWRDAAGAHQQVWSLAHAALCFAREADLAAQLLEQDENSLTEIIESYVRQHHRVDAQFRRFHQVCVSIVEEEFYGIPLEPLITRVNALYRSVSGQLQERFVGAVQREGWPAARLPRQSEVFEREVASLLADNRKVAYLLVDALRYELALELESALCSAFTVSVKAACAQLPTKTEVGMAALLPAPGGKLALSVTDGSLAVSIGGADVTSAPKRDAWLAARFGDRCQVLSLQDLVDWPVRRRLKETVQLVVVRTQEIDLAGERSTTLLAAALPGLLMQLQKGIHKLRSLGLNTIIVAADHGFFFLPDYQAGDATSRPSGDWLVAKDRFLIGRGPSSADTLRFRPEDLGIPIQAEAFIVPRGLSGFQAGLEYFHCGLSLQECIVPLLTVTARAAAAKKRAPAQVVLTYRGKTEGAVTSRMVMIELACHTEAKSYGFAEQWAAEPPVQLQLLIHQAGTMEPVGQVVVGDHVDPTTRLVSVPVGAAIKVPVRLIEEFSGSFVIKALDPLTQAGLGELILKTQFME
jgi:hypothetical protein